MITIGMDPEFFLRKENYNRRVLLAQELGLGGTKEVGLPIPGFDPTYQYHRDNVLLEITTPVASTADEWSKICINTKRAANKIAADHRARIAWSVSAAYVSDEMLRQYPSAMEVGCSPDQDAYNAGNTRGQPDAATVLGNVRTAGGHVHIGTTKGFNCPNFIVALLMDWAVTPVYRMLYSPSHSPLQWHASDTELLPYQTERTKIRPWYRQPGLYRDKNYGIEYRSLSNEWMTRQATQKAVFDAAKAVGWYCENRSAKDIRALMNTIDFAQVVHAHSVLPAELSAMRLPISRSRIGVYGATRANNVISGTAVLWTNAVLRQARDQGE